MEYKRSTFQLGLQARNVPKLEKNHMKIRVCGKITLEMPFFFK